MTPLRNDPEIAECVSTINKNSLDLNRLFREEMDGSLTNAAILIEEAAKNMRERLKKLRK